MTTLALHPPVYLDHNATTPPLPQAVAEMIDVLQRAWANPSSLHASGQAARRVLIDARLRVGRFLDCQPAELVFTSGATEANHLAVLGALTAQREGARRGLVLSAVEHAGLLALALRLRNEGTPVSLIPVDPQGRLDMAAALSLVGPSTALVSVMAANNETGVVMPTAALAALAHRAGALLHVDATQLAGKGALSFKDCGADLMSVSAHKFGGPKGVGALVVRKGVVLAPLMVGRQERQRRGGTENLPGIAGFAAACDHAARSLSADVKRMRALRERLEAGLQSAWPQVRVLGRHAERLCNTSCVQFGTLDAEQVLSRLERAGVLASSGAACSAGGTQPSHVLLAMGCTKVQARAGVRLSLGVGTQAEDIDRVIVAARASLGPLLADPLTDPLFARAPHPESSPPLLESSA